MAGGTWVRINGKHVHAAVETAVESTLIDNTASSDLFDRNLLVTGYYLTMYSAAELYVVRILVNAGYTSTGTLDSNTPDINDPENWGVHFGHPNTPFMFNIRSKRTLGPEQILRVQSFCENDSSADDIYWSFAAYVVSPT